MIQFVERIRDFIDDQWWCALMRHPKSEAVFEALIAWDDAAQEAGDVGTSLDDLFEAWDRQHGGRR